VEILKVKDFDFYLPEELIAQHPAEKRDESRLMVLDKSTGEVQHKVFKDIIDYLEQGDCLVLNDTRVMPARLFGTKKDTESKIEFLLLKRVDDNKWETLVKPGKKAKVGVEIVFGDGLLTGTIVDICEDGSRIIQFNYKGIFEEILDELGQMPLPPYITERLEDKERYQTVYSKAVGSAAAPTAGLHFTKDLMEKIKDKGIKIAFVTLHVGLGTFRPVKVENIDEHHMHSEFYMMTKETAEIINETKKNKGRIIAVGTTSCRTLETIGDENGLVSEKSGWTDIFIYPGYKFKLVDRMITNFHLPQSTLLMLISALSSQKIIMDAYKEAIEQRYRFFSFGDSMFIK
jgi:S-adenosylmethionine:tRNA ribosyltransferase-isomerase